MQESKLLGIKSQYKAMAQGIAAGIRQMPEDRMISLTVSVDGEAVRLKYPVEEVMHPKRIEYFDNLAVNERVAVARMVEVGLKDVPNDIPEPGGFTKEQIEQQLGAKLGIKV